MVSLMSLWAPILVSAVFVFVASSIVHMMLPYHKSDFRKLAKEDEVMDALRKLDVTPGDYLFPRPAGREGMKDPAFIDKMKKGPVVLMTVMPSGPPSMAANLVQWFLYCVLISVFAAYVASRAVGPGAGYRPVFRFAGCTAFIGYAMALWQNSIWYKRAWSTTFKQTFDGLIYGLLTAGTFGWLWPK
jgi:hypothetical protein